MSSWFNGLFRFTRPRLSLDHSSKRPVHCELEMLEDRWAPAVINVISLADNNNPVITAGHAGTAADPFQAPSLRSAVTFANANPGDNTIQLTQSGTYKLTLAGTPGETDNAAGELAILGKSSGGNLTIQNTSGGTVIVDGNHLNRVFDINPANITNPAKVTMQGFTIQNGDASDPANPDGPTSTGGGIRDQSNTDLTLTSMVITHNVANADGGGVVMENSVNSSWTLTITGSTISDNNSGDAGGGIDTDGTGTVVLSNDVITGNTDINQGAGVYVDTVAVGATFPGASMMMTGTVVSNNDALATGITASGGGISNAGNGTMTLQGCTIEGNFSGGQGGGFSDENNVGTLVVTSSIFRNNSATMDGGGIQEGGPSTSISSSEIDDNSSGASGGGLFATGTTLTVTASTFAGNTALGGGGALEIQTTGTGATGSTITNTTIAGNSATGDAATATTANGGGIEAPATTFTGSLSLLNDTINGNFATSGGGGIFWGGIAGSSFALENTIVAQNSASTGTDADNSANTFTDNGGNLIGVSGAGSGNTGFNLATTSTGTVASPLDPVLGPLAGNAGPTIGAPAESETLQTESPQTGSPAINAGIISGAPSVDERGFTRALTVSDPPDRGAVETAPAITAVKVNPLDLQAGVDFGTLNVATFTNASDSNPSDFGIDIAWGDGMGNRGTVTFNSQTQAFTVTGDHVYAHEGFYTITVTVHPLGAPVVIATAVSSVADAPVFITSLTPPPMVVGVPLSGRQVATFADYDLGAASADFQATIAWGDGTMSSGTIVETGIDSFGHPNFMVVGSHTYMSMPTSSFRVTIQDLRGGTMTTQANDGLAALEVTYFFDQATGTYKVIMFRYA